MEENEPKMLRLVNSEANLDRGPVLPPPVMTERFRMVFRGASGLLRSYSSSFPMFFSTTLATLARSLASERVGSPGLTSFKNSWKEYQTDGQGSPAKLMIVSDRLNTRPPTW